MVIAYVFGYIDVGAGMYLLIEGGVDVWFLIGEQK